MDFIGIARGLVPLGGGVKGGGNPSGCGGGGSVAGCNECLFELEPNVLGITPDRSLVSTKGDSAGETSPDSVSDGCMNGFAVVGL